MQLALKEKNKESKSTRSFYSETLANQQEWKEQI